MQLKFVCDPHEVPMDKSLTYLNIFAIRGLITIENLTTELTNLKNKYFSSSIPNFCYLYLIT